MSEFFKPQQTVAEWRAVMPPAFATPQAEFNRSLEEVDELHKAIQNNDDSPQARTEIGSEAVDVIVRMLGVAESVGYDVSKGISEKLQHTTKVKYPNDIIVFRMSKGESWTDAMRSEKTATEQGRGWGQRWNKSLKPKT